MNSGIFIIIIISILVILLRSYGFKSKTGKRILIFGDIIILFKFISFLLVFGFFIYVLNSLNNSKNKHKDNTKK